MNRRTRLARTARLQSRTRLNRTAGLKPVSGKRREQNQGVKSAPKRETGFSRAVKLQCRTRAGNGDPEMARCEHCGCFLGRHDGEVQHRVARGAGGCKLALVNSIVNAALMCPPCHRRAESRDRELSQQGSGFWIEHGDGPAYDPRFVPIALASPFRSGMTVWLAPDGSYAFEAPEGRCAA